MSVQLGDRLRITAVMTINGAYQIMNVFDYFTDTAPTGTDQQVMEDFQDALGDVYTAVSGIFSNAMEGTEVRGFNVTRNQPLPVVAWSSFASGSAASGLMPFGVAGLVLFRTATNRVLGRKFLGGLTAGDFTGPLLEASTPALMAAWGAGIIGAVTGAASGGVWHFRVYDKNGAPRAVTGIVVRDVPAYQRRRKQGVGV